MRDFSAPQAAAPKEPESSATLLSTGRRLWPYIWPRDRLDLKARIFLAFAALVVAKLVTIAVPYSFKWATDSLTSEGARVDGLPAALAGPIALTILYGVLRTAMAGFTQARDALFAAVAMNAVRRLANDVFVHMHDLSLRYHLERKTGALTRVLERGRNAIETMVRMITLTGLPTLLEFALILGVFFVQYDWRYALVTVAMIVAYMTFTTIATNWRIAIRRSMNESDNDANTKAIDSLLNYETVKYFNAEQREAARYDKSMARYERNSVASYTSLAVLNAGQAAIFTVGLTVVMIMSVAGIREGRNTIGDFVLINAMMIQLYQPLNFMGMFYREVKQAVIDIEAMFDILEQKAEIRDRPGAMPLVVKDGTVRFENVFFHYDPAREILKGVDFEVPAGRTIAIVGPSGAGKSTISRLLFRFYEPQRGRIMIDGQDIAGVTQESLRRAIGIVPQDTVLFNDTVEYNIAYGRPGATRAEVEEAARAARIHGFIESTPKGYQTMVGERGLKLSGGEKQRVAIARTLLKNPPIIIFDEATSALDSANERAIQGELQATASGRTTLVIAHRLSTVVDAHEILVMEAGRIIERGTHAELLAQGGRYAEMWALQQSSDVVEGEIGLQPA